MQAIFIKKRYKVDSVGKNTNGKKKRCKRKEKGEGKIKRGRENKKDKQIQEG